MNILPNFFYWLPRSAVEGKKAAGKKHPYIQFADRGLIEITESERTDYRYIRKRISGHSGDGYFEPDNLAGTFKIQTLGVDPYNATQLSIELESDGITVNRTRQGIPSLGEPTKELEGLLLAEKIRFGDDPVLRWMFKNVRIEQDVNNNIRVAKGKCRDKVDGVSALINALKEAMDAKANPTPTDMSVMVAG